MPEQTFSPPRGLGLVVQSLWLLLAAALAGGGIVLALRADNLPLIYGGLALSLLGAALVLWRIYRLYALLEARYVIEASHLRLQWGLRQEIIPLTDVLWARPLRLRPPLLATPGGFTGVTKHPELGTVEFMAAVRRPLIVLATARRAYVLSPREPAAFMDALQRALQTGRLQPGGARSVRPAELVRSPLGQPAARFLLTFTALTWLGLLAWLGLLLPAAPQLAAGFDAAAAPLPPRPLPEMLWLAAFGLVLVLVDWLLGLLLYPSPQRRPWAWALWGGAALTSALTVLAYALLLEGAA